MAASASGHKRRTLLLPGRQGGRVGSVLVGREREMDEALASLDDAFGGRGRLLLLAGEPGIGKSRFAEEVAARGSRTLSGTTRREDEGVGAPCHPPEPHRAVARPVGAGGHLLPSGDPRIGGCIRDPMAEGVESRATFSPPPQPGSQSPPPGGGAPGRHAERCTRTDEPGDALRRMHLERASATRACARQGAPDTGEADTPPGSVGYSHEPCARVRGRPWPGRGGSPGPPWCLR